MTDRSPVRLNGEYTSRIYEPRCMGEESLPPETTPEWTERLERALHDAAKVESFYAPGFLSPFAREILRLRSELEARDAEIEKLGRQHYAALSKLDDETSRLRFELSRSRSESSASVPNTGTALSEEDEDFVAAVREDVTDGNASPVAKRLLAIIDRLSSAPSRGSDNG